MLRLKAVAVGPGVEHHALLGVKSGEDGLQLVVETAFVAVAPKDHGGVVDVAGHHLLHQLGANHRLVSPVPAAQLIDDIEA